MAEYGILRTNTNTGSASELIATFTAPLSILSNKPTYTNETVTLKRKSLYSDVQRWEITAGLAPLANASELLVHNVVNGYTESFYIRMPQIYRKGGLSNNLSPKVAYYAAGGSSEVYIADMGANTLPVGEFIRFHGHSKVYMVKASEKSGVLNKITIFPKLVNEIAANEVVYYGTKCTMTVKYGDDSKIGVTYSDGILAQIDSISLIEAL